MALTKVSGDILDTGIVVAGIVTATEFVGAGLSISGISTFVGVATFKDNAYVDKELYVGGIKITTGGGTVAIGTDIVTRNIKATGVSTFVGDVQFDGDVSIGGTLTYQDVTNIDSVGLGTFRNGIHVTAGVSTFLGGVKIGPTNTNTRAGAINIGGAGALSYSDNDGSSGNMATVLLENTYGAANSDIHVKQRGDFEVQNLQGNAILRVDTSWTNASVNSGNVFLNYKSNSSGSSVETKLETTATGVDITGIAKAVSDGNAGVVLHRTFSGNVSGATNTPQIDFTLTDTATSNQVVAKISPQALAGNGNAFKGNLRFFTANDDGASTERIRISSAGHLGVGDDNPDTRLSVKAASGTDVVGKFTSTDANAWIQFRDNSTTDTGVMIGAEGDNLLLRAGSNTRWKITSGGHLLPNTAGAVNIGSATAEIGDVFLASDKALKLGNSQIGDLYVGSDNVTYLRNSTGQMVIRAAGDIYISDYSGNHRAGFRDNSSVDLYYDIENNATAKLSTTAKGISVHGEVAASQDYPNYRPEFDFNFAAVKKLDPRMTFTRAGEASYHDGIGSVKFVSDNVPRFDHDIVTGECKGLLVEPAGTNYSYYSRRFDVIASGSWVPQNGGATPTITANTHTAPDGTSSGAYMADTITGATGTAFNGNVVQQQHTAGANVKHTFSLYIKLLTATQATIYIRDGGTGSVSSTSAVNTKDWQRVVVTSSANLTNSTVHSFYIGNTNGTIAVWGSQIERSSYVSSYMKTEAGANGTRVADFPRLETEDFTDMISQETGTLIAEFDNQSNDGYVLSIDNGAPKIGMVNTDGYQLAGKQDNGTSLGTTDNGTVLDGTNKFALAYEVDNAAISINGNTATVDTNFNPLPTTTRLWFGLREGQYDHLGGAISRVIYYRQRLSNSQLKTLTS